MGDIGERGTYPSGDEQRDSVIELLCDEWPTEVDYREWDDRCAIVVRLLDVLDQNRLTVIDLGEPVTTADLASILRADIMVEKVDGLYHCPDCPTYSNAFALGFAHHRRTVHSGSTEATS